MRAKSSAEVKIVEGEPNLPVQVEGQKEFVERGRKHVVAQRIDGGVVVDGLRSMFPEDGPRSSVAAVSPMAAIREEERAEAQVVSAPRRRSRSKPGQGFVQGGQPLEAVC